MSIYTNNSVEFDRHEIEELGRQAEELKRYGEQEQSERDAYIQGIREESQQVKDKVIARVPIALPHVCESQGELRVVWGTCFKGEADITSSIGFVLLVLLVVSFTFLLLRHSAKH